MSREVIMKYNKKEIIRIIMESTSYNDILRKMKIVNNGNNIKILKEKLDLFNIRKNKINSIFLKNKTQGSKNPEFQKNRFKRNQIIKAIDKAKSFNHLMRILKIKQTGSNFYKLKKACESLSIKTSFTNQNKKYNLNIKENIFNKINTLEKAYWLGFLASDGYVQDSSNKVSLCLGIKDKSQIYKFIKFINGDKRAIKTYIGPAGNKVIHFSLSNKKFSMDLKKFNLASPKSKKIYLLILKTKD